jgi:hypothetical protein
MLSWGHSPWLWLVTAITKKQRGRNIEKYKISNVNEINFEISDSIQENEPELKLAS